MLQAGCSRYISVPAMLEVHAPVSCTPTPNLSWSSRNLIAFSCWLSAYRPVWLHSLYPARRRLARFALARFLSLYPTQPRRCRRTMSSTIAISTPASSCTTSANATCSVYGTTPGGTPRISYSRDELLNLASSPLSRSPPKFDVPAAISRTRKSASERFEHQPPASNANTTKHADPVDSDDEQEDATAFTMEL